MSSKLLASLALAFCFLLHPGCAGTSDPTATGVASLSWSITVRGQAVPCVHVGAPSVLLRLHPRAGDDVTVLLTCAGARGVTPPVTAGSYDATLALVAADGTTIATSAPQLAVSIAAGRTTVLAPFAFDLDDRGRLAVTLAALGTASNCAPAAQGGAGITSMFLTLHDVGEGCAAVTLTRTRNGAPNGQYVIDCTRPTFAPCIDRDETLSVDQMISGPYPITVGGLSGGVLCWLGQDVVPVAEGGPTQLQTIQLAHLRGDGC